MQSITPTLSTIPLLRACLADTGLPDVIIVRASVTSVTLGSRWVPEPPGSMPRLTSGNPTLKTQGNKMSRKGLEEDKAVVE